MFDYIAAEIFGWMLFCCEIFCDKNGSATTLVSITWYLLPVDEVIDFGNNIFGTFRSQILIIDTDLLAVFF